MGWIKIDDAFPDHPKIVKGGPLALALQMRALCYCSRHLTNGRIPSKAFDALAHGLGTRTPYSWGNAMVAAGLMRRRRGGYEVNDYLKYNPSRAEVLALREQRKTAAKSRWRKENGHDPPVDKNATRIVLASDPVPSPLLKSKGGSFMPTTPKDPAPSLRVQKSVEQKRLPTDGFDVTWLRTMAGMRARTPAAFENALVGWTPPEREEIEAALRYLAATETTEPPPSKAPATAMDSAALLDLTRRTREGHA